MNERVTIGLAGDLMIGRNVNEMINRKGYLYPWGDMLKDLLQTDLNIANLEAALTVSNEKIPKTFNFKADPDKVNALQEAHFRAVSIANNHILDFSLAGLNETIHTLREAEILFTGAGINQEEATAPAIISCKNIRIGILGITDNEPRWKAGPEIYGVNYTDLRDMQDRKRILEKITALAGQTDLVIASIHWGPNMKDRPDHAHIEFAHEMTEYGADIIHGHSAHIFQGIEVHDQKLILYDTGDFIDDYKVDHFLANDHSFFYHLEVGRKKVYYLKLIPVLISNCQVNHAPLSAAAWSLDRVRYLSAAFRTEVTVEGDVLL